mmetsp:Transcript_22447/g.34432  ORF Transcript_22447/g.34432 Transcript_22447/m.34432 type:complete len:145 (-) Transcript_22447:829-1263(-)
MHRKAKSSTYFTVTSSIFLRETIQESSFTSTNENHSKKTTNLQIIQNPKANIHLTQTNLPTHEATSHHPLHSHQNQYSLHSHQRMDGCQWSNLSVPSRHAQNTYHHSISALHAAQTIYPNHHFLWHFLSNVFEMYRNQSLDDYC